MIEATSVSSMLDTPSASDQRLPSVAYSPGWEPAIITARGVAACRLSEFQDVWAELGAEDRGWFAETLSELLVDAATAEMALR